MARILKKSYDVRILVHDAAKTSELVELYAKVVIGDLNNTDTLSPAVKGSDAIIYMAEYFSTTNNNDGVINQAGTIAPANASIAAGVKRFIFVSTWKVWITLYIFMVNY